MNSRDAERGEARGNSQPSPRGNCFECRAFVDTEFEALPESDVRVLDQAKVTRIYQPGEAVFHEGAPGAGVYCIGAGAVCTRKTDAAGRSVPFRLKYAGDTMGLRAFLFGGRYPSTAEALETSRVCFVDGDTIRELLSRNLNLALAFLRRLADDLTLAEEKLLHRGILNARVRLARLLVNFVEFHGMVAKDGELVFKLPFSRSEMAAVLGVTLRTLSDHVRGLQRDGVLQVDGRNVKVCDFSRLMGEAELSAK